MIPNTALVQYSYGYIEYKLDRTEAEPRVEIYLALTDITSASAASAAAFKYLTQQRARATSARWLPRTDSERPDRVGLGSIVRLTPPPWSDRPASNKRMMSMSMTEGDDGQVDWACDLDWAPKSPWEDARGPGFTPAY